ncbi:Trans-1,2-dihydrobenzene-1,2-diol dehydrogenase [Hypsibius exemplaris]|uniref:Trans-1,2-dihydrobenzene-1,2-diol dehydrogenase n=1 Tax=Hypsibius exemplaris TaxID=2072580 RepID=A0A1W0WZ65_HYPEX|nr:Trans-1,2-dihydrobenzene-1,2-diol dehydrogenase [Hypsibius exemplaris]
MPITVAWSGACLCGYIILIQILALNVAGAPLRWGFVGCGRITNDFAAVIVALPATEHQVYAFASRNISRADDYACRFGATKSYASYEALAKDPNVDVVYIGTINPTHYEISKLMLANNKHVLCEKPLTLTKAHGDEILRIAEQKKLFFQEAILTRFFPATIRMLNLAKNATGEIRLVTAYLGQNSATSLRHVRKQLGGGSVKDRGGYVLQHALAVFGNDLPDKISAVGQLNNESVDSMAAIELQWKGGRMASLGFSLITAVMPAEANIYGSSATIKMPDTFARPTAVQLTNSANTTIENYPLPTVLDHRTFIANAAGMIYEAQEVRRCILAGLLESPLLTHKDSLTILAIQDEVLKQIGVSYDSLYANGVFVGSSLEPELQAPALSPVTCYNTFSH